jgi:phosphoribosylaminoimidazolecarboxamide formyltransferase / IMP cyclohydrolase
MPRAILSVSDKTGLAELARGLAEAGWELVSTGGTARALREAGLPVRDVSEVTGHPEMMEGRVKTLHPAIHAGILARREQDEDVRALEAQGYGTVDLVVANLYPFREAVAAGAPIGAAMEQVDIGGPALLRAAAKNHASVLAVVDPRDYGAVLAAVREDAVTPELRRRLAAKVFAHTAAYDHAIAAYLEAGARSGGDAATGAAAGPQGAEPFADPPSHRFADRLELRLRKVQELRYGENPDQPAAFYEETDAPPDALPGLRQLQGKELSFNNLLDLDAAVMAVSAWADSEEAVCVVIKHTTPCGIALGEDAADAFERARAADPVSAFGGIVGLNRPLSAAAAAAIAESFFEVVVAPGYDAGAREALAGKKNLRLIELPLTPADEAELDYKRVRGGLLVQRRMSMRFPEADWRVVSRREPSPSEWRDLRFAWRAVALVKSNAIVLARGGQTLGIGAGQMSRVDAARIATMKAADRKYPLEGAAVASDAFFPFRDGVDAAAAAGATAVIQPGGSVRDQEVIDAADEHGLAMVFTGRRVFRH